MLEEAQNRVETSIAPLLRDILADIQILLRQELALAKSEMRQEATKLKGAMFLFALSASAILIAIGFICSSIVHAIVAIFGVSLWVAYAVTAFALGSASYLFYRRVPEMLAPRISTLNEEKTALGADNGAPKKMAWARS